MQQNYPFSPAGGMASTTNIAVTAVSQQLTLPPIPNDGATVLLTNVGTQTVFFGYGVGTASITTSVPLLAGSSQTFDVSQGVSQIAVIAAATGSTLYASVGRGS